MEEKGRGWPLGLAGLLTPAALWFGIFFVAPLLLIVAYSFGASGTYGAVSKGVVVAENGRHALIRRKPDKCREPSA